MRLYPAGGVMFCVLYFGLSAAVAHHLLARTALLTFAMVVILLGWDLISVIAAIGVPHRPTRLLARFYVAKAVLAFTFSYIAGYMSGLTVVIPLWMGLALFSLDIIYGFGALGLLFVPLTEEEKMERELD